MTLIPPYSAPPPAEVAVLGSCLLEAAALEWCYHNLQEDQFLIRDHKKLFEIMKRMHRMGTPVDLVTLSGNMTEHEKKTYYPAAVGLIEAVQSPRNVRHYSDLMHKAYVNRELEKLYDKIKADPFDVETQKGIRSLWDSLTAKQNSIVSMNDMAKKYPDILEDRKSGKTLRVLSGYEELDTVTGGFHQGNLVVIGARTSIGKTSFLLNLTTRYLNRGLKVLFISAEMLFEELMDRLVSMDSKVYVSKLRSGNLEKTDFSKIMNSLGDFDKQKFWCLEGGRMGINRIRSAVETTSPDIVCVDFIQRFTPPSYNISKASYLSDVANELKNLAKEKRIVVIAASQLNRDIEKSKREDPQLSDYKDSGGIEEAADYSIMLTAEKDDGSMMRGITAHVNKARSGPCGSVQFDFEKGFTLFKEKNFREDLPYENGNQN